MSRGDLEESGESLGKGEAGLVVVAASAMGAKIRSAMRRAPRTQAAAAH
jgi:hypothetical protein